MSRRKWIIAAAGFAAGALLLALAPADWLFVTPVPEGPQSVTAGGERYACPMLCTIRDTPGNCPICGMEMAPIQDTRTGLVLTEHERRMAGLRTVEATLRPLVRTLRYVGNVDVDETKRAEIAARFAGRIDVLHADTTGIVVTAGDPLLAIYSPEVFQAQQGLIVAAEAADVSGMGETAALFSERNLASARQRLILLGFTEDQVEEMQVLDEPEENVIVPAPLSGTVIHRGVVAGEYVKAGQRMLAIADLSDVWVQIPVHEGDLPWVSVGVPADVTLRALPGRSFQGHVTFLDPVLDPRTRTARARLEIPNPDGSLKPGMFAEVLLRAALGKDGRPASAGEEPPDLLALPREAVLAAGDRHLVYVMDRPPRYRAGPDGIQAEVSPAHFVPRQIAVGPLADGWYPVLSGLEPGERVAERGNFLIDSQMQLSGAPSLLAPAGGATGGGHEGHGGG